MVSLVLPEEARKGLVKNSRARKGKEKCSLGDAFALCLLVHLYPISHSR